MVGGGAGVGASDSHFARDSRRKKGERMTNGEWRERKRERAGWRDGDRTSVCPVLERRFIDNSGGAGGNFTND